MKTKNTKTKNLDNYFLFEFVFSALGEEWYVDVNDYGFPDFVSKFMKINVGLDWKEDDKKSKWENKMKAKKLITANVENGSDSYFLVAGSERQINTLQFILKKFYDTQLEL